MTRTSAEHIPLGTTPDVAVVVVMSTAADAGDVERKARPVPKEIAAKASDTHRRMGVMLFRLIPITVEEAPPLSLSVPYSFFRRPAARLTGTSSEYVAITATLGVAGRPCPGESFNVVKADEGLTPAAAAMVLGVTRPYVDRLLGDGVLESPRLHVDRRASR